MNCLLSKFQPQHSYDFPDWILSLLAPSHVTPRHVQIERHFNTQRRGFMINPSKSDAGSKDNSRLAPSNLILRHHNSPSPRNGCNDSGARSSVSGSCSFDFGWRDPASDTICDNGANRPCLLGSEVPHILTKVLFPQSLNRATPTTYYSENAGLDSNALRPEMGLHQHKCVKA